MDREKSARNWASLLLCEYYYIFFVFFVFVKKKLDIFGVLKKEKTLSMDILSCSTAKNATKNIFF